MRAESQAGHCIILLDFSEAFHGANDTMGTLDSKGYGVNCEHLSAPLLRGAGLCLVLCCISVCLELALEHFNWKWDTCTWFKYSNDSQGSNQTLSSSSSCPEATAFLCPEMPCRIRYFYIFYDELLSLLWTYLVPLQVMVMLLWLLVIWKRDLGFIDLENWRTSLAHYDDA